SLHHALPISSDSHDSTQAMIPVAETALDVLDPKKVRTAIQALSPGHFFPGKIDKAFAERLMRELELISPIEGAELHAHRDVIMYIRNQVAPVIKRHLKLIEVRRNRYVVTKLTYRILPLYISAALLPVNLYAAFIALGI